MLARSIFILLIGVITAGTVVAQSPLVITGSFTSVTPEGRSLKKDGRLVFRPGFKGLLEREETYFRFQARLTYHNRGDETIIVPTPPFFSLATQKILFLDIPSNDAKPVLTVNQRSIQNFGNPDAWLTQELEKPELSRYYFAVIEPGGFHETGATLLLDLGFKVEVRRGAGENGRDIEIAVPEHPYFRLKFASAIKDKQEATEPMRDAQRRWRRFGKLLLTESGNFSFETGVIVNKQVE